MEDFFIRHVTDYNYMLSGFDDRMHHKPNKSNRILVNKGKFMSNTGKFNANYDTYGGDNIIVLMSNPEGPASEWLGKHFRA